MWYPTKATGNSKQSTRHFHGRLASKFGIFILSDSLVSNISKSSSRLPVAERIKMHGICDRFDGWSSVVSGRSSLNMHLHHRHSTRPLSCGFWSQVSRCTDWRQLDWTCVRGAECTLFCMNRSWPFAKAALIVSQDLAYDTFGVRIESWHDRLATKGILHLALSTKAHSLLRAHCCPLRDTKLLAKL